MAAPDPQIRGQVEERLATLLERGELLPGAVVPIAALARRWSVSETPVREAGWRAVGAGLLVPEPRGGFRVREPDIDGLRDLYDALELLLVSAIGLLPASASRTRRAATLPDADRGPDPGDADAASTFLKLARLAGNVEFVELIRRLGNRLAPFRRAEASFLADDSREADLLMDALKRGSRADMRIAIRRYCRRRRTLAPATLGLIAEWRRAAAHQD